MLSHQSPLKSDLVVEQSTIENVLRILNVNDPVGQFAIETKVGFDGEWQLNGFWNFGKQVLYSTIFYNDLPIIVGVADTDISGMEDGYLQGVKSMLFTQLIAHISRHGIYQLIQTFRQKDTQVFRVNFGRNGK